MYCVNSGGGPRRRLAIDILRATFSGVRQRPTWELVLVFGMIPALLAVIHRLPGSQTWSLSLAVASPFVDAETLWTAFASSYVHLDARHLLNNIGVYWLTMAAVYPLALVAGWRRQLLHVSLVYLCALPILISWVSVRTLGQISDYPAAGFSGINSAYLGFLIVVLFVALARVSSQAGQSESELVSTWSVVPFFLAIAVAFAVPRSSGLFSANYTIASVLFVLSVASLVFLLRFDGDPRALSLTKDLEFLFVFGLSVVVAGILGSLVVVAPGTNVFAHLTGFVVGFTYPFVLYDVPQTPDR